jgi:DNA mismatch repair protein MSH4
MSTVADTKLISIIRENLEVDRYGIAMQSLNRRYWSETNGHEYVQQLAFPNDLESLKVSIGGNYFAVCSFAAVCVYFETPHHPLTRTDHEVHRACGRQQLLSAIPTHQI